MPTQTLTFDSPERLRQQLGDLFDEFAARIVSIHITRGHLKVEFDKEVELLGYGDDDLWEQIRTTQVINYEYMGLFSLAVMQEMFRLIKVEGLVPSHILVHPDSTLKRTREWRDLAVTSLSESLFLGLKVVQSPVIQEDEFLIAASNSPRSAVYNVVMGVKGQVNEFAR